MVSGSVLSCKDSNNHSKSFIFRTKGRNSMTNCLIYVTNDHSSISFCTSFYSHFSSPPLSSSALCNIFLLNACPLGYLPSCPSGLAGRDLEPVICHPDPVEGSATKQNQINKQHKPTKIKKHYGKNNLHCSSHRSAGDRNRRSALRELRHWKR